MLRRVAVQKKMNALAIYTFLSGGKSKLSLAFYLQGNCQTGLKGEKGARGLPGMPAPPSESTLQNSIKG